MSNKDKVLKSADDIVLQQKELKKENQKKQIQRLNELKEKVIVCLAELLDVLPEDIPQDWVNIEREINKEDTTDIVNKEDTTDIEIYYGTLKIPEYNNIGFNIYCHVASIGDEKIVLQDWHIDHTIFSSIVGTDICIGTISFDTFAKALYKAREYYLENEQTKEKIKEYNNSSNVIQVIKNKFGELLENK